MGAGALTEDHSSGGDDFFFATPAKGPMRCALALSLSTAAEGGMAQTPKNPKGGEEEGARLGSEGPGDRNVAEGDWPPPAANHEEEMGEAVASPDRPATPPSPTPSRWGTQTPRPVPVTPEKGSKKRALAVGTRRPTQVTHPPRRATFVLSQTETCGTALVE